MSKIKYGIALGIWTILVISMMFILSDVRDFRFILILIFEIISLLLSLIVNLSQVGFRNEKKILKISPMMIINGYMIIVSICSIFMVCLMDLLNVKEILLINIIIFAIAGLLFMASIGGNNHISKVETRQKNNHKELQ